MLDQPIGTVKGRMRLGLDKLRPPRHGGGGAMSVERHEIHEQSIGAYLLGALDDAEAPAFEHHLDECPVCRDEVERLRPAVDALPRSVTPLAPSPELKVSLMAGDRGRARRAAGGGRASARRSSSASGFAPARASRGSRPRWPGSARRRASWSVATGRGDSVTAGDDAARSRPSRPEPVPAASGSLSIPATRARARSCACTACRRLDDGRTYQAWVQRGDEVDPEVALQRGRRRQRRRRRSTGDSAEPTRCWSRASPPAARARRRVRRSLAVPL